MTTLALAGCRPEPIGSYLKALGLLRLVAMQVDSSATGWWEGDTFRLDSALDTNGLIDFLGNDYRPTPVLSPWNNDSGFKEARSKATTALLAVEASDDPRFETYRDAIAVVRELLRLPAWGQRSKVEQATLLRNRLPEAALEWLDAAIVLRPSSPAFPALLGTGGNFGRLELSPTFISRLQQVLEPTPKASARSVGWLRAALFEEGTPVLRGDAVGQFDPGAAGGLRGDVIGGKPLTNPWDFVLLIEGSLIWASGIARRLGGTTPVASMPFTVSPSAVGQGSLAPGDRAKAELWAPLWTDPLGLPSLRRLFAEGRISWSQRQARTGLDVARAVHTLGADAGVSEFVRHVVAERMGQSPLAVPVGRFKIRSTPQVQVLAAIDGWVDRLRRVASGPSAPSSIIRASHRVDRALFDAVSGRPQAFQDLLVALSVAEALCGRRERSRSDGSLPALDWLFTRDWLPLLDDGSLELRLAASLALSSVDPTVDEPIVSQRLATVRSIVRPIELSHGKHPLGHVQWARHEALIGGLGVRPVVAVLADVLVARSEGALSVEGVGAERPVGVEPWFAVAQLAGRGDAEALAGAAVDLTRLSDLLAALLLLRPEPGWHHQWRAHDEPFRPVSPAWRVLAPFFSRHAVPVPRGRLRPESTWARQLLCGGLDHVLGAALLRWRQAGLLPIYDRRSIPLLARGVDGSCLSAALLCAVHPADIEVALGAVIDPEPPDLLEGEEP